MDESATGTAGTDARIHTAPRTDVARDQGSFRTHFNFPGRAVPGHDDHGYGPLATVVESFLDPGTLIPMHQHRNEEIVSWVPAGVMRHDDRDGNALVTDAEHLLVMNAGRGFWHAEEVRADDPPLRMLQIFVRPHSLELEPGIQHEPLADPTPNAWRHLFAPERDDSDRDGDQGDGVPRTVRNAVHCYDCRLAPDASAPLPSRPGWDTYLYVFEGAVTVGGEAVGRTESALVTGGPEVTVTATERSVLVAFCLDPDAPVTRQGTIGR
jgi:hypothetical protein